MLIDKPLPAAEAAPTNAGLTAFQVAVVQRKVLEKTLQDVNARKEAEGKEQQARAEEQRERQRAIEQVAKERGGVDVVVKRSDRGAEVETKPPPDVGTSGTKVDIKV